jgi:hypothetical protein
VSAPRDGNQPGAVVAAWVVVLVPTLWGVAQTVIKSLALFR